MVMLLVPFLQLSGPSLKQICPGHVAMVLGIKVMFWSMSKDVVQMFWKLLSATWSKYLFPSLCTLSVLGDSV